MRIVALCLLLAACSAAESAPTAPRPVVDVIDGDTVRWNGETVRISNIDAAETGGRATCWAEAALGEQAKMALQGMLNAHDQVGLVREGRDRYGRTLGRITTGRQNSDLGEAMISAGLAARWTGRQWNWCSARPDLTDVRGPQLGPETLALRWEMQTHMGPYASMTPDR